jgi:hypothetical protein
MLFDFWQKSSQACFGAPPKQLPEWLIGFVVEKDSVTNFQIPRCRWEGKWWARGEIMTNFSNDD